MARPIPWTTAQVLQATGGKLVSGDIERSFSRISIDSRNISADDLFVAIQGKNHDGHDFIGNVIGQGVRGLIVSKDRIGRLPRAGRKEETPACVTVDDTTRALGDLAAFNRARSNVSVVAITGSNGKTTTREMTGLVVSRRFQTLSTRGNLNNEIGLPLTLLKLHQSHAWAVLELGMNRPGEIGRLAEICLPDVGIITNIGPAHLEGLGSMEGIMRAKGELLEKIKPGGTAVLNADDPRVLELGRSTSRKVVLFGRSENALIRAQSIEEKDLGISFILTVPEESISVHLEVAGKFMLSNALAAAGAGYVLGLSVRDIKDGLESFRPVQGRFNLLQTQTGVHIIDDTYNANPGSMEAAALTLRSLKGRHRAVLVAGDMLELGEHAETMHKKIGALFARSGISRLYVTGQYAKTVAASSLENHMDSQDIFIGTREEILENLFVYLKPNDWVLVKGSRAMGMETIVQGLMQSSRG